MVIRTKYVTLRVPQLKWYRVNGRLRPRVVYVSKQVPIRVRVR